MNVIIIEDEPLIADALKFELKRASSKVNVIKILSSIEEALNYFEKNPLPDLFFSDIELPDGLSFSIFKNIGGSTPIIFCTAYDNYALKAFEVNGIDYILKPFNEADVKATLNKINTLNFEPKALSIVEKIITNTSKSILVKKGDTIIPIKTEDIFLVHIELGITYLFTHTLQKIPYEATIEHLHEVLGNNFFKINRQNLIHRDIIKSASNYFGRKLKLNTSEKFEFDLIVGKNKVSSFLDWLANT
ncbi:MAG: LytR/AlgR family response regulator transcription factor [Lishizhenia sp.]